jgi:nucleotide-binding universal stress UspA family protein
MADPDRGGSMGEIVVGVDGSESSVVALRWAGAIAERTGDRLRAIATWQYPATAVLPFTEPPKVDAESMDRSVREDIRGLVARAVPDGVTAHVDVLRGPAAGRLLAAVDRPEVRMLVLGTRGLGGFSGLVLGSVTRQCVEHATVPVVVIPGDAASSPQTIVVGADGSRGSGAAIAWTSDLAGAVDAEVVVAHVLLADQAERRPDIASEIRASGQEGLVEWCKPLADAGVQHEGVLWEGDPRTAILEAAAQRGGDLVVVGSRGTGRLRHLVLGSVASAVVRDGRVPVAVVPLDREAPVPSTG